MVAQERLEHLAPAMPFRSAEDLIPLRCSWRAYPPSRNASPDACHDPAKTRGFSRVCGAELQSSLSLLSWRRGNREHEGIANLDAPEGRRRYGQHERLPRGRLDLHLLGGRINRGHGRIHLPLRIRAPD